MPPKIRPLLNRKASATTDRGLERAGAILRCARQLLLESGFAGLSMRAVAGRVGISLGNLQHYYPSKEALVEALLGYMMDGYQTAIANVLAGHPGDTSEQRFSRVIDLLIHQVRQVQTAGIFLEVWALSTRMGFAAELIERVRTRARKAIMNVLRDIDPGESKQSLFVRASVIELVIEGLMVQHANDIEDKAIQDALAAGVARAAQLLASDLGWGTSRRRRATV